MLMLKNLLLINFLRYDFENIIKLPAGAWKGLHKFTSEKIWYKNSNLRNCSLNYLGSEIYSDDRTNVILTSICCSDTSLNQNVYIKFSGENIFLFVFCVMTK